MGTDGERPGKPAQIMNYFEDEEEHKKVAQLFVSPIRANLSLDEQERAINDAVHKIKKKVLITGQETLQIFLTFRIL